MSKRQTENVTSDDQGKKEACVDWVTEYGFDADKLDYTLDGALPHYVFKVRTSVRKESVRITVFRVIRDEHSAVYEDGFPAIELMAHSCMEIDHINQPGDTLLIQAQPAVVKLEHGNVIHPDRGMVLGELLQVTSREAKKAHSIIWSKMTLGITKVKV